MYNRVTLVLSYSYHVISLLSWKREKVKKIKVILP
jgi:hypothetical protein